MELEDLEGQTPPEFGEIETLPIVKQNDLPDLEVETPVLVSEDDFQIDAMEKSTDQMGMFDELPTEKKKPEISSVGGKWTVKNNLKDTQDFHKELKNNYVSGKVNNFTEFLKSDHPLVDAVKKFHGVDMDGKNDTLHIPEEKRKEIQSHYNNITGRFKERTSGVGQEQTRTLLSDPGGVELSDWHFKVPSLSDKAKLELDSRTIQDTHRAANEGELSEEPTKWLKKYKYVEGREAEGSSKNKTRMLYNKDDDNFDSHLAGSPGGLLSDKEKARHAELSAKHTEPFTDEHKSRLQELKSRKGTKSFDLSKLSDEDKELYSEIQKNKTDLQAKGAHLDTNRDDTKKAAYQGVLDQEQDLVNKYGGLSKTDNALTDDESNELNNLSEKEELQGLQAKHDRTYTPQIQKILKYPHESNLKASPEEDMEIPEEQGKLEDLSANQDELNQHFPTELKQGRDLERNLTSIGSGLNQTTDKVYKPSEKFNFNGSQYETQNDGGSYVVAKHTGSGKIKTLYKPDIENLPSDKQYPELSKESVRNYVSPEGNSLEDIYSKMGYPQDHPNKEYTKGRIRRYLLQNEHSADSAPTISRSLADKGHPAEMNEKEKKILYRIAKSITQIAGYVWTKYKEYNLQKAMMESIDINNELTPFEKSLQSKNFIQTGTIMVSEARKLEGYLDAIIGFSMEKSISNEYYDSNLEAIKKTTERFVVSHNRFDLLKSLGGEKMLKSFSDEQNNIDNQTKWKLTDDGKVESILPEE